MNEIQSLLTASLPLKRKQTPSGWISFNAICCHHNGEKPDTRGRGGVLFNPEGGWQYHCFNCNFKAGWTPGKLLSSNSKKLFSWLGLDNTQISQLAMTALKLQENSQQSIFKTIDLTLQEKSLPENSLPLSEWGSLIENETEEKIGNHFVEVLRYLIHRGYEDPFDYDFYWSNLPGYYDRVIIPFRHQGIVVGYTARKITQGKPKYLSESQPSYVFNLDRQGFDKQYLILVEGPFDALAVDGAAILHNEPSGSQILRINQLRTQVIVVPDRDRAGAKMLKAAIENDWSVSMPPWEADIKDVADAVKRYGKLYTLFTILKYRESNKIKIEIMKKKLENNDV